MNRTYFIPVVVIAFLWGSLAYPLDPAWEELYRKAENMRIQGKYSECLKTYKNLLELTKTKYGENNVKVAEVLVKMALVHRYDLGNEKEYEKLQHQAKTIQLTLNGTIRCQEPESWSYENCRERWLGPDPCFAFRSVNNYIKVTYYGLDDSRFKKPGEFITHLKELFGSIKAAEKVRIDGREATRIKLRYDQGNYRDPHGAHRPPEFIYEEFIILPLKKGFLVFNFKLNHSTPLPADFSREQAQQNLYGNSYDEYQAWVLFTGSCKINR